MSGISALSKNFLKKHIDLWDENNVQFFKKTH